MRVTSTMANLYMLERRAFDACYRAMCYGSAAESRLKVIAWRDAKAALAAGHE